MNADTDTNLGPIERKQRRERSIQESLLELRRAIHDGEWGVALAETTELGNLLAVQTQDGA